MNTTSTPQTRNLLAEWEALKSTQPTLRNRDAAAQLGISEAQLIASRCPNGTTRLRPDFRALMLAVPRLGHVMALTRNASVVHERKGHYLQPSINAQEVGLFEGDDIDLRIFWAGWAAAFAVVEHDEKGPKRSLQFFDRQGHAIHKVHLTPHSDVAAFAQIVDEFADPDQLPTQAVAPGQPRKADLPDSEIDVAGFQAGWINLQDTHHFFGLLRTYKVGRQQAMRLAPAGDYATPVSAKAFRQAIGVAALSDLPVMIFVGNDHMIQIHTGPVKRQLDYGTWFNIMDPHFNLHLDEAKIAQAWVVRKPTADGVVTSLELFDAAGDLILQLFGKRKPGSPELSAWRDIAASLV
jgi:putative hemin transport protein